MKPADNFAKNTFYSATREDSTPIKGPIKVLLADDTDIMGSAIAKLLSAEPTIDLVGEATSFAETVRQCVATNPDVLLIDLHMPDEREYPPEHLNPVISYHARNIIALSVWHDDKTRALAHSFGARLLLDKAKLFAGLLPAIEQCSRAKNIAATSKSVPDKFKRASAASDD